MEQFEDLPPEYRQGTYLGRLPRELRQLTTRYEESCNYEIRIRQVPSKPNMKTLVLYNTANTLGSHIPFERRIRNDITMREFISSVKQGLDDEYKVTSSYSIRAIPSGGAGKNLIGLYSSIDRVGVYIIRASLCRELEDALYEMEAFQNS